MRVQFKFQSLLGSACLTGFLLFGPGDGAAAAATNAPDSETWWSLRPLARSTIPLIAASDANVRNPIDAFILARLRAEGLELSPEADRRTLARRLYFDLTGLPPSFEEVEQFVQDPDPAAYESLVQRLLRSPRYGERWARHWLDVAHYGDTHGYDKDQPRPHAWPYRDYVIRALNADKPYSQFVQEQIAGDALYPGTADGLEALGFIAAGPWDFIGHAELPESKIDGQIARHLDRDDMVATTLSTFNSLTVHCAQCHNHKFDPIPSEDYYSLQAVFAAVDRTNVDYYRDPELNRKRAALRGAERDLTREKSALLGLAAPKSEPPADPDLYEIWRDVVNRMAAVQSALAEMPAPNRVFAGAVHTGSGPFRGTGADGGKPRPIHLLARGDVRKPGKAVRPGALSALAFAPARFELPEKHSEADRRAALAQWITHPGNPLTWRSIVNRVWQYHFGRGLVETPSDFGRMGARPSHPELLDWLAVEFRDGGQSLKSLHRLIVTSAAYRQVSVAGANAPHGAALDADNRLLWRMNRRKLEAEAIRDSILAVSGQLDPRFYGPAFQDFVVERPEHSPHYQYHLWDPQSPSARRRSIYRFIVRSQPQPLMAALDCADPSMHVDKRNQSVSAPQALALMNNAFTVTMASQLDQSLKTRETSLARQIHSAFTAAFARDPTPAETAELMAYAAQHGLANAARFIFNLTEFSFVD